MLPPLHRFRPRLLDALRGYDRRAFGADLGAGLTVGVVALPLAMAFAIASGVKPEQGLFTAIVGGLLVALLGGSNVQIAGPAGAFVVIVYGIVERYGLTNLLISTALAGVLLCVLGWLRLGALVRYMPLAIVVGFTNGIAVLIGFSQLRDLLGLRVDKLPADFFAQLQALATHLGSWNPHALALGLGCVALLAGWRRLPLATRLPGPVVALALLSGLAAALGWPVETIGTRFGGIPQSLPSLELPPFSWDSAKQLLIPTLTIALLGAVESLLCARVADNASELPRHDPNQELVAQGLANLAAPLVGGMPVTGTIARTMTNVRSGARTPVAGIVHSLTLLAIVLVAAPLAAHVPLAVLAGILLFTAWNMGEWHEFARLRRHTASHNAILLGSFVLTVAFDLMVAVQVGLVLAFVFFVWRMGRLFRAEVLPADGLPAGVQVVRLDGALFFGAVGRLETLADGLPVGTRALVLDLHRLIDIDATGLDALLQLRRTLARQGVTLWLAEAAGQPLALIQRGDFDDLFGPERFVPRLADALARAAG